MNESLSIVHQITFADYFVICGLDKDSGLEPDKYFGDLLQCTPLDRAYKGKVLGHYPQSVPWSPFEDHAVCMLCLPNGLRFRTQKHLVEPSFHSFVITKEDGHRNYGFSLVFYEECRNRKICAAMQTLQAMFVTELSSGHNGTLMTFKKENHNTRSLPRHFKLSAHSSASVSAYYDSTKDKLFVTKSISLLCQHPYLHAARTFLTNLYKCVPRHPGPGLSLESYVHNLLYNVPIPLPGKTLKFFVPNDEPAKAPLEFVIYQPLATQLPLLEYPIKDLFAWLDVESILQLFTCVMLENQVLLKSSDFHKLMVVAECITALLYPFTWQHVYVPILPASLDHFLDAPVPFIMGFYAQNESGILKIASEANLCYVDLDKPSSQFPEEIPVFPYKSQFLTEIKGLLDEYKILRCEKTDLIMQHLISDNIMSTSTNSSLGSYFLRRKHSLHDVLDWDNEPELLQRKIDGVHKIEKAIDNDDTSPLETKPKTITSHKEYQEILLFNTSIREIFMNWFVQLFFGYEHFLVPSNQDEEECLKNGENTHVFDKATFLSDQSAHHLPFLSRFLETQTFASFIDSKITSYRNNMNSNVTVFDQRVAKFKEKINDCMTQSTRYKICDIVDESKRLLEDRINTVDFETDPPIEILPHRAAYFRSFPLMDSVALNKKPTKSCKKGQIQWKYKTKLSENRVSTNVTQEMSPRPQTKLSTDIHSPAILAQANWTFVETLLKDCKAKTKRMLVQKMGSEATALGHGGESVSDVEENTLIASLCDLLERVWSHGIQNKQGKSALWSHLLMFQEREDGKDSSKPSDVNFLSPEKSVTLARLVDRCTKINRRDYLATACFLHDLPCPVSLQCTKDILIDTGKLDETENPYPKSNPPLCDLTDLSNFASELDVSPTHDSERHKLLGEKKVLGPEHLRPLPDSLIFDIRNIQAMTEIRSHIGFARAWVRLALEKKLLSKHLKTLLSVTDLIRNLYKRSAFLRCEEEKEQFLYYLLTLNAVDYFCFTNNYPMTKIPYRIIVFPSSKSSASSTSANSWIIISGSLCETSLVHMPKGVLEFLFHVRYFTRVRAMNLVKFALFFLAHKSLGVLSTVRIGHDNTGISPKWMVEHVIVRNEVTGHTYKFPCGRWLGRGIDDDSTERLLFGSLVPKTVNSEELLETCSTPPRCRSPSIPRHHAGSPVELQHRLGEAVNAIVKYQFRKEYLAGSLTVLLCGENGLVFSLEQIFLFGYRNQRLFGKNFYVWDFLVKVKENFEMELLDEMNDYSQRLNSRSAAQSEGHKKFNILRCYCHLVDQLNTFSHSLGKDGKFQLFVCLAAREQLLQSMLKPMSNTRSAAEMYEETSFIRSPTLLTSLVQILEPLNDLHIVLEKSLTHGISSLC